jgi:hypothetical protein
VTGHVIVLWSTAEWAPLCGSAESAVSVSDLINSQQSNLRNRSCRVLADGFEWLSGCFWSARQQIHKQGLGLMRNQFLSRHVLFASLTLGLSLLSPVTSHAATGKVALAWEPIVHPELGGYTVLWGQAPGSYTGSMNVGIGTAAVVSVEVGRTYYMAVRGYDKEGLAGDLSTEVTALINANGPIKFTQIILSNVGDTSVTINWKTDKVTTGLIEYGPALSFSLNGVEVTPSDTHTTVLTGLTPSTLYHYVLTAVDSQNNRVTSGLLTFKTSDRISERAKPSSEAIFIPSVVENARFRTNLGINNLAAATANVSLTLVDMDGLVLGSETIQVEPEGMKQLNRVARLLFKNSAESDIEGNLYVESDQPVKAWASQIDNATNDPSMLVSTRSGSTKILIPSSANTPTFSSSLVIMNVGSSNAEVALKSYATSGELLGQTTTPLSVPPNGIVTFENVLQALGVVNNYGPIEITSLNNIPLIASSRVSSTKGSAGFFEGLNYADASTVQTLPHVMDTSAIRTNVGIDNVADLPANVVLRLFDKTGTEIAAAPVFVPAKGMTQINHVVRQLLGRQGTTDMEGYIRLESDQPIFGWASQIDNSTNDPGFVVTKGQSANRLLVQSTANVGSFRSSLVVVNANSAPAWVDLVSRDVQGIVLGELRGIQIAAGGFFSTANILETLGVSSNYGPVEIISTNGQPVMATSRVYSTSGTSGFFEGQPIQ